MYYLHLKFVLAPQLHPFFYNPLNLYLISSQKKVS